MSQENQSSAPSASVASSSDSSVRFPVRKIAVHKGHHFEEMVAVLILRRYGRKLYPGIHNAPLVYWERADQTPDGRTVAEHEREGTLVLGIALARLDDHRKRRANPDLVTCSAKLVADDLGVADDPRLEKLLDFAALRDSRGGSSAFELPQIIKDLHARFPDNPRRVIEWAYEAINAHWYQQCRFYGPALQTWREKAQVFSIPCERRAIRVGFITSDDDMVYKVGRCWTMGGCQIVVVRHQSNNVQIFVDQRIHPPRTVVGEIRGRLTEMDRKHPVLATIERVLLDHQPAGFATLAQDMGVPLELRQIAGVMAENAKRTDCYWVTMELARFIRLEELRRKGVHDFPPFDPELAASSMEGHPEWYLLPRAGWVFNGSNTSPGVPPTAIPQDRIQRIIHFVLAPSNLRDELQLTPVAPMVPTYRPLDATVESNGDGK